MAGSPTRLLASPHSLGQAISRPPANEARARWRCTIGTPAWGLGGLNDFSIRTVVLPEQC